MIVPIDDPADARLDDYRALHDQASRRAVEGDAFFVAEGYVALDRVIDSGHSLRSVLAAPSRVPRLLEAHPELGDGDVPLYVVERPQLADVVGFDLHRGVVATADRRPLVDVATLAAGGARLLAVLEGLNDAENVGVIARAARALGVDAMVLDPTCTDPYTRRTVRVSMGEVLHLPIARATDWPADLDVLHRNGFETWALTPAADADDIWLATADPADRVALLLGAEGPGLSAAALAAATRRVRIPIQPAVDSLNVGHAAAIAFAATTRGHGAPGAIGPDS